MCPIPVLHRSTILERRILWSVMWMVSRSACQITVGAVSEAGELASELRWVSGGEADEHCREPESRARVLDELADVTICVLMLADRIEADLPAAVHDKLKRVRVKYPPGTK